MAIAEVTTPWPKPLRRIFYAVVVASGIFVLQLGIHWGRGSDASTSTVVYMVLSGALYAVAIGAAVRGLRTAFVRAALALAVLHFVFMALFFASALQKGLAMGWSATTWTDWAQKNWAGLAWNGVLLVLSAGLGGYLLAIGRGRAKER